METLLNQNYNPNVLAVVVMVSDNNQMNEEEEEKGYRSFYISLFCFCITFFIQLKRHLNYNK
jgi:hypothetical protein